MSRKAATPSTHRVPVRAAFAFAGGGSLGSFLSGALREIIIAIRYHNAAIANGAPPSDVRYIHPTWGHITIDAIGGCSAGALCSAQLVKSMFEPDYVGESEPIDTAGTLTGDWIRGGDFSRLTVAGNQRKRVGPVESPGWTLISGALLQELATRALSHGGCAPLDRGSTLDPSGVIALGITLTDLLGYHDPAEFAVERVLGHPQFGCTDAAPSRLSAKQPGLVRDLGGKGHAETRRLFIASDAQGAAKVRKFLIETRRRGRARAAVWSEETTVRLAALSAASAALPFAVGPVALTDRAAEVDAAYRRLYMDGGVLNNKPVAPALRLARWHDAMRVIARRDRTTDEIPPEVIKEELLYERVCFFLDAFPDRCVDEWRGAHPDHVFGETGSYQLTTRAGEARSKRIEDALDYPAAGLGVFLESIMTSLRAHDIRVIAKTNAMLRKRDGYIDRLSEQGPTPRPNFRLDTPEKAAAYAAVLARPASANLSPDELRGVAYHVHEADGFSDLAGRRPVTMVPVFAPNNLHEVFAGEALYSLGGLLHEEARRHDAMTGGRVAREVIKALRRPDQRPGEVHLPSPSEAALPRDTAALMTRMHVAATAVADALESVPLRTLARWTLRARPLFARVKRRLDRAVQGVPDTPYD